MAYMDKNTYKFINKEDIKNIDNNDIIELDEMIAPIIQLLNLKGYKTSSSCSGHPYKDELIPGINIMYISSYITFEDGIILPSYPKNAIISTNSYIIDGSLNFTIKCYKDIIKINNSGSDYYRIYNKIVKVMKIWMKWAERLPDYNKSETVESLINLLNKKKNKIKVFKS